jgi:DNA replication and repair protein RecF
VGKNAQGKSSVLEAIYVAATTRSWRAGKDVELISWEADESRVSVEVEREEQNDIEIEVTLSRADKKHISINTVRQTRLSDVIGQAQVLLIEPEDGAIIRGEPGIRRRFLNLEISQIQPMYCHLLAGYRKVLEQRNRLLKDLHRMRPREGVLDVWNEQLVSYGSRILERRLAFVGNIVRIVRGIHSQITDEAEDLDVVYSSRMNLEGASSAGEIAERFRARMAEVRDEEIHRGITLVGPQRDDVDFRVNGVDARTNGSHGQQRTIALSLRLAELEVMQENAKEPPIVLLDDVMTDLDDERRSHIFAMTQGRCQTFMTAPSDRSLPPELLTAASMFRVSGGKVIPS